MSALLCCGACFDTQNLGEEGNIYQWLDMLLTSTDDKVNISLINASLNFHPLFASVGLLLI
jgi:hypothetical protein